MNPSWVRYKVNGIKQGCTLCNGELAKHLDLQTRSGKFTFIVLVVGLKRLERMHATTNGRKRKRKTNKIIS